MVNRILRIAVVTLWVSGTILAGQPEGKIRGLWVVRHNLKKAESIDSVLAFAEHYRFTDLFVQVRGRGDAYYHSNFEPLAEGVDSLFDPLKYLLNKTQGYNFRIHAWINVFYLWSSHELPKSPQHLVNQKPEWIVYPVNYDPEIPDSNLAGRRSEEGLYLSPMIPGVQEHIIAVVEDILSQYEVDGLHLDYIRYPGFDFDFNPVARADFKQKFILDPLDFRKDAAVFVSNFGETGYDIFFSRWSQFLRDGLSDFVDSLSVHVREKHPGIIISAAVKPDLGKAHWQYYQEWDRWLKEGWLDWAVPMNYAADKRTFLLRTEKLLNIGNDKNLLMGISLYNQAADSAMYKTRVIENLDIAGYVFFSYDQIVKDKKLQRMYSKKILTREARP